MNNIIVYCETDGGRLCDVSLELMTKARDLAAQFGVVLQAPVRAGDGRASAGQSDRPDHCLSAPGRSRERKGEPVRRTPRVRR